MKVIEVSDDTYKLISDLQNVLGPICTPSFDTIVNIAVKAKLEEAEKLNTIEEEDEE